MLHVSAGGGSTWSDYNATLQDGCSLAWGTYLYQAGSTYNSVLLARQMAVCRSTNRGISWTTTTLCPDSFGYVSSMTIRRDNPAIMYISGYYYSYSDYNYHGKLFKTTDAGLTWTAFGVSAFDAGKKQVLAFISDPFNPSKLLAGTWNGVYTSSDGGSSWLQPSQTSMYATCFAADPNVSGRFWAGTEYSGVWMSTNSGTTWQQINTGLNSVNILCLVYDEVNRILYAGTKGSGAYRFVITGDVEQQESGTIPSVLRLEQNYPNPFNPTTTIRYQISDVRHLKLAVYDLLGREVAVLANETQAPGSYTAVWNGTGLSSGVYVCRLSSGGSSVARTMILAK